MQKIARCIDTVILQTSAMPKYDSALTKILEIAGGPTRVARHLGIVASAVTQWSRVPARHVPRLEALTGLPGRVIRPDLYPAEGSDADRMVA